MSAWLGLLFAFLLAFLGSSAVMAPGTRFLRWTAVLAAAGVWLVHSRLIEWSGTRRRGWTWLIVGALIAVTGHSTMPASRVAEVERNAREMREDAFKVDSDGRPVSEENRRALLRNAAETDRFAGAPVKYYGREIDTWGCVIFAIVVGWSLVNGVVWIRRGHSTIPASWFLVLPIDGLKTL